MLKRIFFLLTCATFSILVKAQQLSAVDTSAKPMLREFLSIIVPIGYGVAMQQKDIPTATTHLKAEDFNQGNINDPMQLLQGKVAGLSITRAGNNPNEGCQLRLRGISTINGNPEPLFVIDGVPNTSLQAVDPADIESMTVLKDAGACAMYGMRGSSGVILLTTKHGQSGKLRIEYNGLATVENRAKTLSVLSAAEFAAANPRNNLGANTDWLSQVARQGISQAHNLSLGIGNQLTKFRIGLNYRNVQGIAYNDGYQQYNGRIRFKQEAFDHRLTLSLDAAFNTLDAVYGLPEVFRYAFISNPTQPVYDASAAGKTFDGFSQLTGYDYFNPVAIAQQTQSTGNTTYLTFAPRVAYEFVRGLTISVLYAQNRRRTENAQTYSKYSYYLGGASSLSIGDGGLANRKETYNTIYEQAMLQYRHQFGKLDLGAVGGYEYNNFLTDATTQYNLPSGYGSSLYKKESNLAAYLAV